MGETLAMCRAVAAGTRGLTKDFFKSDIALDDVLFTQSGASKDTTPYVDPTPTPSPSPANDGTTFLCVCALASALSIEVLDGWAHRESSSCSQLLLAAAAD